MCGPISDRSRKRIENVGLVAGYAFFISLIALVALSYYSEKATQLSELAKKKLIDATYGVMGAIPTTLGITMLLQAIGRKELC